MPTHGLGRYRRFLLGSITAKVLHDTECPVWTDNHSQETATSASIACKKVLCAIDLGDRSRAVLEWAGWLAREYEADLRIVNAAAEVEAGPLGKYLDREFAASGAAEARTRIAPGTYTRTLTLSLASRPARSSVYERWWDWLAFRTSVDQSALPTNQYDASDSEQFRP